MVLRNWYNLMKAYRARTTIPNGLILGANYIKDAGYYVSTDSLNILCLYPTNGLTFYTNPSGSGPWFVVGRGTTPATLDDYALENMIRSGLTCTVSTAVDEDNDAVYKLTLTNTSSEDITIGEVGIHCQCYWGNNSSAYTCWALLERTVLDTPITIPAGGLGVIDYTIKLNPPTA
jgi:hypothetical protein